MDEQARAELGRKAFRYVEGPVGRAAVDQDQLKGTRMSGLRRCPGKRPESLPS